VQPLLGSEKLQEEYYMLVSSLIVKEYYLDDMSTALFDEVIKAYSSRGFNKHLLRIINDVFEDGNDDRMWRFVPIVLPVTLHYI
jgi:hypothetical protein